MSDKYLLIKHSEGWNVDRCCGWMDSNGKAYDWFYPLSEQNFPDPRHYSGVVIFGGATSANDDEQHAWVRAELKFIEDCMKHDVGFLGICLGAQMLARVLGAKICAHPEGETEIGQCEIEPTETGQHFLGTPMTVMQWHREAFELPDGAINLARSELFENQAYCLNDRVFGVQFHPEVNPESLAIWQQRNREKSPEQFSDEQRKAMMDETHKHDAAVSQWFSGFLTHWTNASSSPANEIVLTSNG